MDCDRRVSERPSSQQQQQSEQQGFPGTAEVHEAPGNVAAGYVEIQGLILMQ
jgi:hypothetical protein